MNVSNLIEGISSLLFVFLGILCLVSPRSLFGQDKNSLLQKLQAGSFFVSAAALGLAALFLTGELNTLFVLLVVILWLFFSLVIGLLQFWRALRHTRK